MHALNAVCTRFNDQLKAAMAAIHLLSDQGCVPREIRLSDRRPVIVIDRPGTFIQGAMRRRERVGVVVRSVMAAPFYGCQVEWEVSEQRGVQVHQA